MYLALSSMIKKIDEYSDKVLGIPLEDLILRSGRAVAECLRSHVAKGSRVTILAGSGNNGGDGYALAYLINSEYDLTVYDVFGKMQEGYAGRAFLERYRDAGGRIEELDFSKETLDRIRVSDCIVDAVFGTGFEGSMPDGLGDLIAAVNSSTSYKIAIDVPLGVNADDGSISEAYACSVDTTVALSFIKPGLVSYPARSFVGRIVYDDIGLPIDQLKEEFSFNYELIDKKLASEFLPTRDENGSKGSFGRLLVVAGSMRYRGAAHLAIEAALRGGAGYVTYAGPMSLADELRQKFPEVIYKPFESDELTEGDIPALADLSLLHSATLVGSGSSVSDPLLSLVRTLISSEGGPLILDADAINALADKRDEAYTLLSSAKRPIVLTPHPLEFSRLFGMTVASVQSRRIETALEFSRKTGAILVLKGAGTIVTDGKKVYINSTGSSALSKAGSGDVLAGFLASQVASSGSVLSSLALSVYYHGEAADVLADELSVFGVTPSDLPREIARRIASVKR